MNSAIILKEALRVERLSSFSAGSRRQGSAAGVLLGGASPGKGPLRCPRGAAVSASPPPSAWPAPALLAPAWPSAAGNVGPPRSGPPLPNRSPCLPGRAHTETRRRVSGPPRPGSKPRPRPPPQPPLLFRPTRTPAGAGPGLRLRSSPPSISALTALGGEPLTQPASRGACAQRS